MNIEVNLFQLIIQHLFRPFLLTVKIILYCPGRGVQFLHNFRNGAVLKIKIIKNIYHGPFELLKHRHPQ